MKKIDMHVHLKARREINRIGSGSTYCLPEELLAKYEELGVDRGVILPEVNPECLYGSQSQEEILEVVQKYEGRFSWFCNIDPRGITNSPKADFSYWLTYYKELGAKGLGEICANLYFDDPRVENLFAHCEKNDMPVVFHIGPQLGGCYGLVDELGLPRLEKELQKFPKLKFFGHSQPFWAEISSDINDETRDDYPTGKVIPGRIVELMRKYDNLYGDMSAGSGFNAVSRDPQFGFAFIEEFQDRLFYATDICAPENDMKLSHWLDNAVENNKISRTAYEKVCRKNAERILGL